MTLPNPGVNKRRVAFANWIGAVKEGPPSAYSDLRQGIWGYFLDNVRLTDRLCSCTRTSKNIEIAN
jgi:hypothetical protein